MMTLDEMPMEKSTLVAACYVHFGLKHGQMFSEFVQEIKRLTPMDKVELVEMFKVIGVDATKRTL